MIAVGAVYLKWFMNFFPHKVIMMSKKKTYFIKSQILVVYAHLFLSTTGVCNFIGISFYDSY